MHQISPRARPSRLVRRARWATWVLVAAVVVLSVAPAGLMPPIGKGTAEHFLAYLAFATAAALGYGQRLGYLALLAAALACAAVLEVIQLPLPGRTMSWTDFLAGAVGAAVGVTLAYAIRRWRSG